MTNATTQTDRRYPATLGTDVHVEDVTIDSLGNRYLVVGIINDEDGRWLERRDLNYVDGEWVASGRIYTVDSDSNFMVVR